MNDFLTYQMIFDNTWQIAGQANDLMYLVCGEEKSDVGRYRYGYR